MPDHEHTDVNVLGIVFSGLGLAIFIATVLTLSLVLFRGFGAVDRRLKEPGRNEPGTVSLVRSGPSYDGPLLQLQPEQELAAMRTDNARELSHYAWEDKGAGTVRIPIDAAMKLLVQRGLPVYPPVTLEDLQRQRGNPEPGHQLVPPR